MYTSMYIVLIYICKSYYADIPEYVMNQGRHVNIIIYDGIYDVIYDVIYNVIHADSPIAVPRK